jgi:AbrB family looped-hinge helix DNA binding protein
MRITSKGQITIPAHIRERHGLLPNTEVDFEDDGKDVKIVKRKNARSGRGAKLVEQLRGTATVKMTTDQILALTRKL